MENNSKLKREFEGDIQLEIRYILPKDNLYEISNVYEQSWKYAYKDIIPENYLNSIPSGTWADNINKNGAKNIVILEKDIIIGTLSFSKSRWEKDHDYGEIISIYFLPQYIGKGHGKVLLDMAIKELKSLGFTQILLWVLEENHRARNFYEKYGFIFYGEYKNDDIGGKVLKEMMYEYQIKELIL